MYRSLYSLIILNSIVLVYAFLLCKASGVVFTRLGKKENDSKLAVLTTRGLQPPVSVQNVNNETLLLDPAAQ